MLIAAAVAKTQDVHQQGNAVWAGISTAAAAAEAGFNMWKNIINELEHHLPFTIFGASTGIVVMLLFKNLPQNISYKIFYILHPLHVVLSTLVSVSIYKLYKAGGVKNIYSMLMLLLMVGVGAIGIATLSDSIFPYIAETILKMPHRELHIGFIEEWWIVNPAALLGLAIAYFMPTTKIPHAAHILVSTWAKLFHVIMAISGVLYWHSYFVIFFFLIIGVWLPCCFSDIVFPLLFVGKDHIHGEGCCSCKK
jgi:hypothetical protein